MIEVPSTSIHVVQAHIPKQLSVLVNDKINTYKKRNLHKGLLSDQVGILIGYNVIKTTRDCAGYCDYTNKVIAFNGDPSYHTIFHEVAHGIQAEYEVFESENMQLFSHKANLEWQAETIAYTLYKNLINKNVSHTKFNTYFNSDHLTFLRKWYGKYLDDNSEETKLIKL